MRNYVKEHETVLANLNKAYTNEIAECGNAFSETYEALGADGILSAFTEITAKYNHLKHYIINLRKAGKTKDEVIANSLLDLANYCVRTVMEIQQQGSKTKSSSKNEAIIDNISMDDLIGEEYATVPRRGEILKG